MRKAHKRKLKVLAVDAAILFAAVQMTLCISGKPETGTKKGKAQQTVIEEKAPEMATAAPETERPQETATQEPTQAPETPKPTKKPKKKAKDLWNEDERYMLCKIAMAEAEDQSIKGKALVILVVLNRVRCNEFPDTIEGVIFQKNQFSPIKNGRYDKVEPDDDCWIALDMVASGWDESQGALYFESESASTWHRNNLKFLFKNGDHYFYTEKGD